MFFIVFNDHLIYALSLSIRLISLIIRHLYSESGIQRQMPDEGTKVKPLYLSAEKQETEKARNSTRAPDF